MRAGHADHIYRTHVGHAGDGDGGASQRHSLAKAVLNGRVGVLVKIVTDDNEGVVHAHADQKEWQHLADKVEVLCGRAVTRHQVDSKTITGKGCRYKTEAIAGSTLARAAGMERARYSSSQLSSPIYLLSTHAVELLAF